MSESKMSPGPWVAGLDLWEVDNNVSDPRIVWSDSTLIIDCRSEWIETEEAVANAKAVAAVPDLIEALEVLLALHPSSSQGPAWDAARNALQKAGAL